MDIKARQQLYRRTFNTEAGRLVIADLGATVRVQGSNVPYDNNGRIDAIEAARLEGRRGLALEIMALAGIELQFAFPPLDETKRPTSVETEQAA